jgi:hypothetical protein
MILNIIVGAGDDIAERMQGKCLTVLDVLNGYLVIWKNKT